MTKLCANSALWSWMVSLGSIAGMELTTGPYTFRRGNSEALDYHSKYHNRHWILFKLSLANCNAFSSYIITTRPCSWKTIFLGTSRAIFRPPPGPDADPEVRLLCRQRKTLFKFIKDQHGSIVSIWRAFMDDNYLQAYHDHRNARYLTAQRFTGGENLGAERRPSMLW